MSSTEAFLFCLSLLATTCPADIIWSYPFDTTAGEWTAGTDTGKTGTVNYNPTVSNCPNGNYCWELQENYYVYHIRSTQNYDNITLTFSVNGVGLNDGNSLPDACSVYYSIDDLILPDWGRTPVALATFPATYSFPAIGYQVTLPPATADNVAVGIKLESESNGNANKADFCYFSDVTLRGNIINTAAPTSPTTAAPTTDAPTTAMPSVSPTTADPSTSPTTANPTATRSPTDDPTVSPTTSAPTGSPTSSSDTTTTTTTTTTSTTDDDDQGGNDNEQANASGGGFMADYGLYVGIGAGVLVLIVVAIILCVFCRNSNERKQSQTAQKHMEQDVTKQYLDAYTGGGSTPHAAQQEKAAQASYDNVQTDTQQQEQPQQEQQQQQQQPQESVGIEVPSSAYNPNASGDRPPHPRVAAPPEERKEERPPMPAPPVELAQIFGRPDVKNDKRKDSDEDSLMKKQRMYSEDDSD